MKKQLPPTSLVLACGYGLVSQALKEAGYKCLGAIDYADGPAESFRVNLPNIPFWQASFREINAGMICKRFGIKPYELDLLQASPPCTGFSSTGTFEPFHVDNELYFIAMFFALQLKPRVILFENVPSMTWDKMKVVYSLILQFFHQMFGNEYHIDGRIMNSNNYGDPQARHRLIFLLVRKDVGEIKWPELKQGAPLAIKDVLPDVDYIVSTNHGERVYQSNEAACTITAHANITIGTGGVERPATPRELAKLMGLLDSFILVGSIEEQIKGLGNGVPVAMMRELALFIRKHILCK